MNTIPELTELARENEDFSGEDKEELNGGYAMPGATWTMGAMFAQTSGLPLKLSIDMNAMDSQRSFFPAIETLGDILEKENYQQVFLLGSAGYFGGRKLYFETHGDYTVEDYSYWKARRKFAPDYWVNWGFEDRKLFSYAKEELGRLSADPDRPFNLTLLTVDTHFPDGYICPICPTYYHDQYSDVFACASRQVSDFVEWAKTQSWYDNTTIIISGDHPTMDHDFCQKINPDYDRRVYTCYIHADAEPMKNTRRTFSTFDNFPTTLAALGVKIPGNRLGLGTNLFSSEPTLTELYGVDEERTEVEKHSKLMARLEYIDRKAAYESKEAKEAKEKEEAAKKESKEAATRAFEKKAEKKKQASK